MQQYSVNFIILKETTFNFIRTLKVFNIGGSLNYTYIQQVLMFHICCS